MIKLGLLWVVERSTFAQTLSHTYSYEGVTVEAENHMIRRLEEKSLEETHDHLLEDKLKINKY